MGIYKDIWGKVVYFLKKFLIKKKQINIGAILSKEHCVSIFKIKKQKIFF